MRMLALAGGLALAALSAGAAATEAGVAPAAGALALVDQGVAAPLWVDAHDFAGVGRAASDLQADVERVTGVRPDVATTRPAGAPQVVIIGTVGHSALIDALVRSRKLDIRAIRGRWEAYLLEVVAHPLPGVDQALVIAGSDRRGTIYGIYELSAQIGVSPWYWWADVPVAHHAALFVPPGRQVDPGPAVKYRGIFLNDEAPDLTNWVREKFGEVPPREDPPIPQGVANYGRQFYARVFELILRLKGNYLWPAMWHNAFNEDDPENSRLADEYGIVMGTSHQEPMLRAQEEWDRRYLKTIGHWNYTTYPDVLQDFWREGVRRNKACESIITMGLRGANDTPMAPGGPEANRELLEKIVAVQRSILAQEMNRDVTQVPQVWCLYKEVQEFYDAGMRVPDDVTLLWAEDNWGNLRRLPTAAERTRSGGAGIYYHFDYHGGPRSYQWINANPLPKIWDQMSLAYQYGADRVWIVNVGHLRGYELPIEFFLDLAWDPHRGTNASLGDYTRRWAAQQFGPAHAGEIAEILARYAKFNGRRKPELLARDTYSQVNYHEAEDVVQDFAVLLARAKALSAQLPADERDAFYQLVLFPVKASALVNALYFAAGRNALYARQGRASANAMAEETRRLFQADLNLMDDYNHTFAGGRWDHFMDQPHFGYTGWRDPPRNSLQAIPLIELAIPEPATMAVTMEGSEAAWPGTGEPARLPQFDSLNRQRFFIDVFNRGQAPFDFTVTPGAPWLVLSATQGTVGQDQRLWVSVDWDQAPAGTTAGTVKIAGAGLELAVNVEAFKPAEVTRDTLNGFVEGNGCVSIEPEHYTKRTEAGANHWMKIDDYGRTLSGMRAEAPVDAPAATPGKDSPCLEYRMYLFSAGAAEVTAITSPVLNFIPDRPVRYAVSVDDEAPQVVTLVPAGRKAVGEGQRDWEKSVADNAHYGHSHHTLAQPGYHTLKIWMVDPAVVMQKLIVDLGGLKPSYLGPPESFWRPIAPK